MPIERSDSILPGMPSARALEMATDAVNRLYVLPETREHPVIRAQCLQLAYLIQAFDLASRSQEAHPEPNTTAGRWAACQDDPPRLPDRRRRDVARDAQALELVDA